MVVIMRHLGFVPPFSIVALGNTARAQHIRPSAKPPSYQYKQKGLLKCTKLFVKPEPEVPKSKVKAERTWADPIFLQTNDKPTHQNAQSSLSSLETQTHI